MTKKIFLIIPVVLFLSACSLSSQKTESEMLRTPNFGRKSLNEIKEVLQQMDLILGTSVPDWPPENIEELAKQFEDPFNK